MNSKLNLLIALITITACLGGMLPAQVAPAAGLAYIEPGLSAQAAEKLSVIVSAASAQAAAQAVQRAGGQVSSQLWLINAVAATLPATRLADLAATPGVVSVVDNKGVRGAGKSNPPSLPSFTTDQAWPVAMDVGADALHAQGITGNGVTVAVVDSGVY